MSYTVVNPIANSFIISWSLINLSGWQKTVVTCAEALQQFYIQSRLRRGQGDFTSNVAAHTLQFLANLLRTRGLDTGFTCLTAAVRGLWSYMPLWFYILCALPQTVPGLPILNYNYQFTLQYLLKYKLNIHFFHFKLDEKIKYIPFMWIQNYIIYRIVSILSELVRVSHPSIKWEIYSNEFVAYDLWYLPAK